MDRAGRNKLRRLKAEVFEELATEITSEVIFLEDMQNLQPDVGSLDNIAESENNSPDQNEN